MKKDVSIIFRTTKDTKDKIIKILKRNDLQLSSLLNAYMLDTIQRDMVPINIRSKMRVYSKSLVSIPEIKKALTEIINAKYKGKLDKCYLFGSYSRGEETGDSDVDISFDAKRDNFTLCDMADLTEDLQNKIGKEVDLVRRESCRKDFLDMIVKEEICIYEQHK